jgi:hypothetical protein
MSQFDFRNYLIFKGSISRFCRFFEKRWLDNLLKNEKIASFQLVACIDGALILYSAIKIIAKSYTQVNFG